LCGWIVTNWFSHGKKKSAASLSCGDTKRIPACQTAYTLFYLNQLDPGGQPASEQCTTRALCLSLSAVHYVPGLGSKMCSPCNGSKWMEEYTNFSLYQFYHSRYVI